MMLSSRAALRALARSPSLRRTAAPSPAVRLVKSSFGAGSRCLSSLLSNSAGAGGRRDDAHPSPSRSNGLTAVRPFSTEGGEESASEELSALLARELEEEESTGSVEMPPELSDLRSKIEEEWRVVDGLGGNDGSGTVRLYRKSAAGGGAKVALSFHCQDTIADEEEESEEGGSGGFGAVPDEGEEEEDEEESVAVRFTVTVTRAGKTMVLSCLSENADATVEGVALVEGDADSVSKGVDESLYQGPEFSELAEDLQESFTIYLQEDLGIDGDVAAFIAMYADYREQMEYVGWLKGVQSMIQ